MSTEFSDRTRTQNIGIFKRDPLDVLVIGGGIVGAGLIRDLARNGGIKAGLIEQGDFASGTSSATSQLVHGGFRYLLKRDIALVKTARKERDILRRIAPTLVKPIPLALLCYKGDPYPLIGMQLAASYYNRLSQTAHAEKSIAIRDLDKIQELVGPIATAALKGCVLLWDSTVDDARLTLLTLKDAHVHGAIVANYVRFVDFVNQGETGKAAAPLYRIVAEDVISRERFEIAARKIVSATGPWSDAVWRKDPSYDGTPRLLTEKAKGVHLILPRCGNGDGPRAAGLVTFTQAEPRRRRNPRVIFVLPGANDTSIIGTTETTPAEDLSSVRASAEEITDLLSEAQRIFPDRELSRDTVIGSYAGTRPLIATDGSSKHGFVSREHAITESQSGVMYLYGGKLTTHRQMAEEATDHLTRFLGVARSCETAERPLLDSETSVSDGDTHAERLIQRYGTGYNTIKALIAEDASLGEPIAPPLPFLKAELLYTCWGEMAITLEDLLWRRTRIGWTPGQGVDIAPTVARFLGERHRWNETRIDAEVATYRDRIQWLNFNL